MPLYSIYKFSYNSEENKQMSIEFFRNILGEGFENASPEEMGEALSNIYINRQSLKGRKIDEAANLLRESLDVSSHNTAMFRDNDGSFKAFDSNNYISMLYNGKIKINKDEETTDKVIKGEPNAVDELFG